MLLLCLFSDFISAFALLKLQKHGKQGNFHVFRKKLHKKQADFLCVLTVELSRAAHIHYIYKRSARSVPYVQRLLLKFLIVFPYAIIISHLCVFVKHLRNWLFSRIWRIAQIPNVPYVPNVRYVPNVPDNPAARFFRRRPYIPAPESWPSALILRQRKVDSSSIYIMYIYERSELYCPAVQSLVSSVQKQAKAQPNRNTTSHTTGSSLGAIWSTQPPANALVSAPSTHNIRTITGYLQPVQTLL